MFRLLLLILSLAVSANAFAASFQYGGLRLDAATTATGATTTTLTNASKQVQIFTGSTTQTVVMPAATTLSIGYWFKVINASSGAVTVQDGGAGALKVLGANSSSTFFVTSIGSTAGTWYVEAAFGNFSSGALTGSLTGNASTATALASNPADCGGGAFANAIAANGDLTCASPSATAQPYLYGTISHAVTGSCAWSYTLTSAGVWVSAGTDSDCPTPSVTGGLTAPATKLPGFTMTSAPAGTYQMDCYGWFRFGSPVSGDVQVVRLYDGTNGSYASAGSFTVASDSTGAFHATGTYTYGGVTSNTFTIQMMSFNGSTSASLNDSATSMPFQCSVFYFPTP